jgi:hypothetical protein
MNFVEFCVPALCLTAALWVYFRFFYTNHGNKQPRTLRDLQQCRIALRSSTLASRAAPNQRLAEVFNIDNALTTTNRVYHDSIVQGIRLNLQTPDDEWNTLATFALNNLRHTILLNLVVEDGQKSAVLVPVVQSLVFRVVLLKFFPKIIKPSEDDVQYITTQINLLWLATKHGPSQADSDLLEMKGQLKVRLRRVFGKSPDEQINGRANPLNIIIPAYESIWRVVLRCFLEVRFRKFENEIEESVTKRKYKMIFRNFMSHPNPSVFESSFQDTHIAVKHIVNEALRLYPPTRSIHRQLNNEMVRIDVEWLHRDPVSWGRDAEEFKPERWVGVLLKGVDGKMAFTPFGLGGLSCPAKKFAPMMIGILVGALVGGVDEGWEVVDEKLGGDVLGTKVLDGGREAYEGLRLRRFNDEE